MSKAQKNSQNEFSDAASRMRAGNIIVYQDKNDLNNIRIENLTVRVPGREEPLVEGVNMNIPRGARVIVTGESGSGKTTLVKAMLSLWNHGEGVVAMPGGARVMTIPQVVYLPNVPLRSVLNMTPEGQEKYNDRDLRNALYQVGLPHLVQHIPGQQAEILMDEIAGMVRTKIESYGDRELFALEAEEIKNDVLNALEDMVGAQFEVVQHIRPQEREYLKRCLTQALADQKPAFSEVIVGSADTMIDVIDIALAKPLAEGLKRAAVGFAKEARKWHIMPYGENRAAAYARDLRNNVNHRLDRYLKNQDTEDPNRDIRLNKIQAEHVANVFAEEVCEQMQKPLQKGLLRQAFNIVSLPLRLAARAVRMTRVRERQMKDLMFNIAHFMESQIVRGDRLAARLSGGQKKNVDGGLRFAGEA